MKTGTRALAALVFFSVLVLFSVLVVGCSCGDDDVVATQDCDATRCLDAASDARARDGGASDAQGEFCEQSGPALIVGDAEQSVCSDALADKTFRFAICACNGIVTSSTLRTDAFDSNRGVYSAPGEPGGSVGSNEGLSTTGAWSVGGSLWSSGVDGWTSSQDLDVAGELHLAGRLAGTNVEVGTDAFIADGVQVDSLRVDGTLTVPAGETVNVEGSSQVGAQVNADVSVEPPCACGDEDITDVSAFVAHHASDNDNASIDLDRGAYANLQADTSLSLPCGRYYLSTIAGGASLSIRAEGRVALFIGQDVSLDKNLEVTLAQGAEIDVFVAGNVNVAGQLSLGSPAAPHRARFYVGGTGTINLPGGASIAANIYAPRAEIVTSGPLEVFGALFARRVAASDALDVHFDTAILGESETCAPPAQCQGCGDCPSSMACTNGTCGGCTDNSDCCAPLICVEGTCGVVIR